MIEDLLIQAIKQLGGKAEISIMVGTVESISDDDTCKVDDFEDVRLSAIIDNLESKFIIYPKIGSKVIIGLLEGQADAFIMAVSEPEKVIIKIADQSFEMKDGKFTIKSGTNNLKTILSTALDRLINSQIIVPDGIGTFSPDDKTAFGNLKTQVNQLLQ